MHAGERGRRFFEQGWLHVAVAEIRQRLILNRDHGGRGWLVRRGRDCFTSIAQDHSVFTALPLFICYPYIIYNFY
jgi:hypothetical protein